MNHDPLRPLDYRPLSRVWAKAEIFLGLAAAGSGLFAGVWGIAVSPGQPVWLALAAGLALFVLGGYLAMAGHRSHLYQSANEHTRLIQAEIAAIKDHRVGANP